MHLSIHTNTKIQELFSNKISVFLLSAIYIVAGCLLIGIEPKVKNAWGIVFWASAILLAIALLFDKKQTEPIQVNWRTVSIFLGLFLVALLIRLVRLDSLPVSLNGDEGSSGLNALEFINGERNNIFIPGWLSFPGLHPFIQSIFIRILGRTVVGVRMSSAIIGALTAPVLYLVSRKMFNEKIALFSAIFLCGFAIHNHMSRIGLNNIWDAFWLLIIVCEMWNGIKNGDTKGYIFAGLAIGFSQYFYTTSRIFILLTLAIVLVFVLTQWKNTRLQLKKIAAMYYLGGIVMSPLYVFYAKAPQEFLAPFDRASGVKNYLNPMALLGKYWNAIRALVFTPMQEYFVRSTPLVRMPSVVFFFLGIVFLILFLVRKKFKDERTFLIFGWIIAILFGAAFSVNVYAAQRYTALLPAIALIVGIGIYESVNSVGYLFKFKAKPALIIGLILACLCAIMDIQFYFRWKPSVNTRNENGSIAYDLARYFAVNEDPQREVIFFGYPVMGYGSIPCLPYLVPDDQTHPISMTGHWGEAEETPTSYGDHLTFVFMDARQDDYQDIKRRFPGGYSIDRCINDFDWTGCYHIYEWKAVHQ
jgi:4-amino-4-deoxy-L-arabinose transferase-like glycosyltransferase